MWACYALDDLSKEKGVTLKEAVNLQQREFSILELDASNHMNRILSERELEYLSTRQKKYEDGLKICQDFLDDHINVDELINQFKKLRLLDIREDLYNLLPNYLQKICDS